MSTHETDPQNGEERETPQSSGIVAVPQGPTPRWNVTPEMREKILETAMELCTSRTADGRLTHGSRAAVAAMRVIATFDKLSLEQSKIEAKTTPPAQVGREEGPRRERETTGGTDDDAEGITDEEAIAYLVKVNGEPEFVLDTRLLPDNHPVSPGTVRLTAAERATLDASTAGSVPWWELKLLREDEQRRNRAAAAGEAVTPRRGPESVSAGRPRGPQRPRPR